MRAGVLIAMGLVVSSAAWSHGGGLDANGCHNDRKNGGYHCHRAPAVLPVARPVAATPPVTSLRAEARPAMPQVQARAAGPVCYTGPRGGTYTITASGRKNYSGC